MNVKLILFLFFSQFYPYLFSFLFFSFFLSLPLLFSFTHPVIPYLLSIFIFFFKNQRSKINKLDSGDWQRSKNLGVVEIDERAKMKTKVDELDFDLQTPQSTFWWLDTYQIWWWWGLQTPQSAFWSLTIYWSVVAGLGLPKWTPSWSNSYLRLFAFFWNGYSLWVCQSGIGFLFGFLEVTIGIMVVLDGHNDAESNCGRLDL